MTIKELEDLLKNIPEEKKTQGKVVVDDADTGWELKNISVDYNEKENKVSIGGNYIMR